MSPFRALSFCWSSALDRQSLFMDNPLRFEEQHESEMADLIAEKDKLASEVEAKDDELNGFERDTENFYNVKHEYESLKKELAEIEGKIDREDMEYKGDLVFQNRLQAYKSIMDLSSFYANAANLGEKDEEDFRKAFIQLQQAEAALENEQGYIVSPAERLSPSDRIELTNIFESYMTLSKYFSAKKTFQVDFSKVLDKIKFLNEEAGRQDGNDNAPAGEAGQDGNDKEPSDDSAPKSYQDLSEEEYVKQSNKILQSMLDVMIELPVLESVHDIWSNRWVSPPDRTVYLEKVYSLYRDNNRTVTRFERAINKLVGRNGEKRLLTVELLLMALMVDGTSVWLIFLRGKGKNYVTGISDMRRLLSFLFVNDSEGREAVRIQKQQSFCAAMGVVTGVLAYILYRMKASWSDITIKEDIFSFAFFSVVGLVLGLVAHRFYHMVLRRTKRWEDEELYIKLKKIWLGDARNEQEWNDRIDMLKSGAVLQPLELSEEAERRLRDIWKREHEQRLFHKYFSESVNKLFENIQEKECFKYALEVKAQKSKLDISGWGEKMVLPCLAVEDVEKNGLKTEFAVLQSKHIVGFDLEIDDENAKQGKEKEKAQEKDLQKGKGYYILTERFWNLLYDTILLKMVGSRVSKFDIEEELYDGSEDEEED